MCIEYIPLSKHVPFIEYDIEEDTHNIYKDHIYESLSESVPIIEYPIQVVELDE